MLSSTIVTFPYLGNRNYVHSTTILSDLHSRFPGASNITAKFKSLGIGHSYKLTLSESKIDLSSAFAHGKVIVDNIIINYSYDFITDSTSTVDRILVSDNSSNNVNDINELIKCLIFGSKVECENLYDHDINKLLVTSVEICNLDIIEFPLLIRRITTATQTRMKNECYADRLLIAKLKGMIIKNVEYSVE